MIFPYRRELAAALSELSARLSAVDTAQVRNAQALQQLTATQQSDTAAATGAMTAVGTRLSAMEAQQQALSSSLQDLKTSLAAIASSVSALRPSQAQGFEHLDKRLYDELGGLRASLDVTRTSVASSAEHLDKKIYDEAGALRAAVDTLQRSLATAAEHLDKKVYDESGSLRAAVDTLQKSVAASAEHLDKKIYDEIGTLRAIVDTLQKSMAASAEHLDKKIYDEIGSLRAAVDTLQKSMAASAEHLDKKIYDEIGSLRTSLASMQTTASSSAEYLDKKIFDTNGEIAAAIKALLAAQGDTASRLDRQVQAMQSQVNDAAQAFDIGMNRLLGRVSSLATSLEVPSRTTVGHGSARYLDLLEADLTGTLHGDVSAAPWAKDKFEHARREVGRDWPKTAATMIGTARMRNVRHLCERVLAENVPGDFIETGVWRGGACIYMRAILDAFGNTTRRVFVADSFAGLPPPNVNDYPADKGDTHYQYDQLAISRQDVEANFRRYGLLDEQVVFLEGWFKDTLPRAPIEKLAILRLDGDMYESTIQALDALYAKVAPGGFVIVDDYVLKPCAEAVDDFRKRHRIDAPLVDVDGAAVWWRVPK